MRRDFGFGVLPLLLGAVSAQKATTEQILTWVAELPNPEGRLLVQEKLLRAGEDAVPHLMRAVGQDSWVLPARLKRGTSGVANWTEAQLGIAGRSAALRILQEMGAASRSALPQLIRLHKRAEEERETPLARHLYEIHAAMVAIDYHDDRRMEPAVLRYRGRDRTSGAKEFELPLLLHLASGSGSRRSALAARQLLVYRVAELRADPKLQARCVQMLNGIARNLTVDPKILPGARLKPVWPPTIELGARTNETILHDAASHLLAVIDPKHPWAERGLRVRLTSIRSESRLLVTAELGRRGGKKWESAFALMPRLADPVRMVRQAAITSLGMLEAEGRAAIPFLRELVHGDDKGCAVLARAALRQIDPKPSPLWTYFHRNGEKQSEGKCEGVTRTGPWTFWNVAGEKTWEGSYVQGKMEGEWTYYANGKARIYLYKAGVRLGPKPQRAK